jgi:hypothetical protein
VLRCVDAPVLLEAVQARGLALDEAIFTGHRYNRDRMQLLEALSALPGAEVLLLTADVMLREELHLAEGHDRAEMRTCQWWLGEYVAPVREKAPVAVEDEEDDEESHVFGYCEDCAHWSGCTQGEDLGTCTLDGDRTDADDGCDESFMAKAAAVGDAGAVLHFSGVPA